MSEQSTTEALTETSLPGGHIQEMGILNLLAAKTAEDLKGITSIAQVGVVLIPEHLAIEIMKIPMHGVGTVAAIPNGENINVQVGQFSLPGEALAAGDPEKILVLAGQLFVTSVVQSVGYKGLYVVGQMFAPRGSESALLAKTIHIQGQIFYLPANPRIYMGEESIGAEFLELLPEPTPLVILGDLTIEKEVSVELLKSKVSEIVLMGQLHVSKALHALAQVLTKEKMGEIEIYP